MTDEIWLPVVDYEGLYEVSNLGRVKSYVKNKNGQLMKPQKERNGYMYVSLSRFNKKKNRFIHVMVAIAFIGQPPTPEHEVNHINLIKSDNTLQNLEYITHSANLKHWYQNAENAKVPRLKPSTRTKTGKKLKADDVQEIKRLLSIGVKQIDIASRFEVTQATISEIKLGKIWPD